VPELPSAPWQAAQAAPKLASPLAKSGFAALAGVAAGSAVLARAGKDIAATVAAKNKEVINFIVRSCLVSKTTPFYNGASGLPFN
jgi:deoxyxylulose-5-phosphate synthase